MESDLDSVAKLFLLVGMIGLVLLGRSGSGGKSTSTLLPRWCDVGFGGGSISLPPSRLGRRYLWDSSFSFRLGEVAIGVVVRGDISGTTSGSTLLATGLRAARLSLRPIPDRQSSSLILCGLTSIVCARLCDGFGVCCTCSACSRCSHAANAEFFFTGDSERSRFAPVAGLGRVTNGSLAES